ncbi:MAG: 4-alpha-glucanotransferase [Leptolyngbyaceae bacterium]|nr:4-alpha-glucanotransferase [Leptolyngbyaceae bacterium]
MPFPRASGLLLHPTSLPGRFGIGDLGLEAYRFVDFLVESGQQLWQVLPLGPTGYGNSPYMCYSAIAGNPLLISPELLRDNGFLQDTDLADFPEFPSDIVDFDPVIAAKLPLLHKACDNFRDHATAEQKQEFQGFCEAKSSWLDDYALFMALKEADEGSSWHTWAPKIAKRQPEVMDQWRRRLAAEIFYHKYLQFEFFRQWSELKHYANQRSIQIIGDIPIYVAHDSADVWAHPQNFCLDEETGEPALMAGVPPDYFSATGQLWGNPVYNWEHLQKTNFHWWVQRFEAMLDYVDLIRIDHFRGFEAYWAVPQGETTAINGKWIEAPGTAFFKVLNQRLGQLPILAEDLGVITPEVEALRDEFEFPGMKVLHFAFGSDSGNPFLPFNYPRNCLVYTGTHDNDTTLGWFHQLAPEEQESVVQYLGCNSSAGIHWDLIRLALASVANQAVFPLQDVLGLGTEARMNFPGKAEGNWAWRYPSGALTLEVQQRLKTMTERYGRAPARRQHSDNRD